MADSEVRDRLPGKPWLVLSWHDYDYGGGPWKVFEYDTPAEALTHLLSPEAHGDFGNTRFVARNAPLTINGQQVSAMAEGGVLLAQVHERMAGVTDAPPSAMRALAP